MRPGVELAPPDLSSHNRLKMRDPASWLHYFAYGSNMLTQRLRARVPSARPLGAALLIDHALSFSKQSLDGSGKATIRERANGTVYGVIFELPRIELPRLDAAEEAYSAESVHARLLADQESIACRTYYGQRLGEGLRPYSWYTAIIAAGAEEHGLPASYVRSLARAPSMEDPDPHRRALNQRLLR